METVARFEGEERRIQEETEAIRVENGLLRDEIREVARVAQERKKEVKGDYTKSTQEYSDKFRQ